MKKIWWIIASIVLFLLVVYVGGSWYFSTVLIDAQTQPLEDSIAGMESVGVDNEALPEPKTIAVPNGDVTLEGWYYENPADGDCAVMLLHGYTSTRAGAMQYAPLFWDRGCHLLAYDARGHGSSSDAFHTYGYYEKEDATAVYNWLLEETGLSNDQVGLTGVSYGAATSLQAAPLTDPAFVIADSAYQDLRTIVAVQAVNMFGDWVNLFVPGAFFMAEIRTGMDADEVSPRNAVVGIDTPLLITHSLQDAFTASTNSEGIYENANKDTAVLKINDWGAPHGADIFERPDEYEAMVDEFLAEFAPEFGD